jgi:uncharacterized RDD family membrane protein YckC
MNQNASRFKLLAACVYELLLLVALWMLCTWLFVRLFGDATSGNKRYFLQFFLWLVTSAYFVWCWVKSGQTLATKTWKIKLINAENNTLNLQQAIIRYALASALMLAGGASVIWMLLDKDRLFLHDRLLRTRFVNLK